MAVTGLLYPVFAPITSESYGSIPTYGTGFVIGEAISADITLNYGDNPLYSNNRESNNDKSFTDGSIKLGIDDYGASKELAPAAKRGILGLGAGTGETDNVTYIGSNPPAPYGGTGYYKTSSYRDNGGVSYEASWIYKTRYVNGTDSAKTKGKSTEWQTPELDGKVYNIPGLAVDRDIMETAEFATEAEARAWLNEKANIETPASNTPLNPQEITPEEE